MRKALVTIVATCVVAVSITCISLQSKNFNFGTESAESEQEESANLRNSIEEAFKQEFEKTKDPATNDVPRERLAAAKAQVDAYFNSAQGRSISGINWVERGPNNVGGRLRALIFDKNDNTGNTVIAGSVNGGLWKASNFTTGSYTWVKITDFLDNVNISCIVQDTLNPQVMYVGTGEGWGNADASRGSGLYKTTDGGATWNQLASTNNSGFYYTQKLVLTTTGILFAGTSEGVKKSTNGGISWSTVLYSKIADMEVAANNDLYASNFYGHVFKSTAANAGALNTWTDISPSGTYKNVEIAIAPSDNQKVYLLCEGPTSSNVDNIYRSDNGGTSWVTGTVPKIYDQAATQNTIFTRLQAWYDLIAVVDPNAPNTVYVAGIDICRSTDGAATWTQVSTWASPGTGSFPGTVHSDHHALMFSFGSSAKLLDGNDGGVYYSANANLTPSKPTFTVKNTGLNITQFYACAISPTSGADYFLAGAQDNGSHQFTTAGVNSTTQVTGGDGMYCHIYKNNAAKQVTSYTNCSFYYSANSFSTISRSSNNTNGPFVNPTDVDAATSMLYGGYTAGSYCRWPMTTTSTVTGVTCTAFGTATVSNTYVSPNTADRIYFGLTDGKVVYVDAASTGTSKAGVTIKTGTGTVSGIAIEPTNENHILVTYSNYGVASVFETTDGGTNWTNIENNLPDMPVRWVIFNPANATQAFLATELGVWTTSVLNGPSTEWTPTNRGFANARVDMVKARTSDNTIVAATHSRGLFTTTLSNTVLPETYFSSTKATYSETGTVSVPCGLSYRDVTVKMSISDAPASDVTATITAAANSTATLGKDFALQTNTVTFPAGSTADQTFTVRIYDDNDSETNESLVLNYSITSGGAAATKSLNFQTFQLDITDNDVAPHGAYTAYYPSGSFTTNLGGSSPLQGTQTDKRMQYLYKASELTAAGLKAGSLASITFTLSTKASAAPFNGFTIKMANTTATDLAAGFVSPAPTFTTIYSAPVGGYTTIQGENTFPATNFTWDGTSNIVFEYCYDNSAASADDILSGEQTGYTSQAKMTSTTGTDVGCSLNISTTVNLFRPVILFGQQVAQSGVSTALNNSGQYKIGPYETVSFYDASGDIIATIKNRDNFDYGCTTVTIDRAGSTGVAFWNNNAGNFLASKSIYVTPTTNNITGNVDVTLYYTAAEKAGWVAATGKTWYDVTIASANNGLHISNITPSSPQPNNVSIGMATDTSKLGTNYSVTAGFTTGLSGFAAGVPGAALPVSWLGISGRIVNEHSQVNWATGSEQNSDVFIVERSDDGIFFHAAGRVGAAGNSTHRSDYSFIDPVPAKAVQFYRVRQQDRDGSTHLSDIIRLQGGTPVIGIGPNPFSRSLSISFPSVPSGNCIATLMDMQGRKVMEVQATPNAQVWILDLQKVHLAAGIYQLRLNWDGNQVTRSVIKKD